MKRTALILCSALLLASCTGRMHTLTLTSEDGSKTVEVQVEIADNVQERAKGLMYRENLDDDKGMFFAFKQPQMLAFWMKNTLIPIEISYFDANGRFINSHIMQPCTQDPCPTYESSEIAQYALETNKTFRTRTGVGVGWTLNLAQVNGMTNAQ